MELGPGAPLLIVVSAPSGGGKTTLCHQVLEARPNMARVITCTTRPPRGAEKDGLDYYFLDEKAFLQKVEAGLFLEHAVVYGKRYGTLKSEVVDKLRARRDVILSMDVQGVETICAKAKADPELQAALVTVFLTPPSLDILEQRLCKRGVDSPEVMRERLAEARREIARWSAFDYLILSTSVAEDLRRMQAIIEAEKMRSTRARLPERGFS
jgi:guanylate kinase